jgi:ribosomal protein S18 acetylase RimI-like enzyme
LDLRKEQALPHIVTNPTNDELCTAIEANFRAYFKGFTCLPHMVMQEDDEAMWFVANSAPGNSIFRARIAPARFESKLAEIIATMSAKEAGSAWWHVFPNSQPADLASRLLAAGWRHVGGEPAMVADLHTLDEAVPAPANFRIVPVTDDAMLYDWYVASASGFEGTLAGVRPYYDAYACLGFDPNGAWHHYLGYLDDEPVTSSTLLLAEGLAGIYDVSTIPSARHKGLGKAITRYAMQEAQRHGYQLAMLFASAQGHSVYRSIGFHDMFQREDYEWRR